jgi:(Z)-2-((N-methylformamido)methylene)-5-hydroxybutyrolactone dehydrogenase
MTTSDTRTPVRAYSHYIAGEWVDPAGEASWNGVNPATEETWYTLAVGDAEDVDRAVRAASAALEDPAWRDMTQTRRGALLRRLGDLVLERVDELARIETLDNGKLLRETTGQAKRVPEFFYYYGGLADKIQGDVIPGAKADLLNYTRREPIGVVAAIVPWNSPLQLAAMKLGPALACGNTVVLKPSEHASASLLALMPLFEEAGFPKGVVNLVTGAAAAGEALVAHPLVNKVAFTGGTEAGRQVAVGAASHFASTTLELGGKSPQLVFEDADPGDAAMGLLAGIFAAAGQTCVAGSRAFVHADIYDEVVERVADRTGAIRVGDPLEPDSEIGPLAIEAQRDRVERFVASGADEGATLQAGGKRPAHLTRGWFFEPTVFSNLSNEMTIAREEIFGPVLGIGRFESDAEALRIANDTRFGLAAGVWTNNLLRAHTFANRLEAGTVWINTYRSLSPLSPFGGVKDSGIGKENGTDVVREYTRVKSVWVNLSSDPIEDPFVGRRPRRPPERATRAGCRSSPASGSTRRSSPRSRRSSRSGRTRRAT